MGDAETDRNSGAAQRSRFRKTAMPRRFVLSSSLCALGLLGHAPSRADPPQTGAPSEQPQAAPEPDVPGAAEGPGQVPGQVLSQVLGRVVDARTGKPLRDVYVGAAGSEYQTSTN